MHHKKAVSSRRAMRPIDRQRMRPWLISLLDDESVHGLSWLNKKQMTFEVKWRHGARHGWNRTDADVFERWAKHTGKFKDGEHPDPKRWKANFRCALNSLADIKEDKNVSITRGSNAFRVYKILVETERKPKISKNTRTSRTFQMLDNTSDGEDTEGSIDTSPSSPEVDIENSIPDFKEINENGDFLGYRKITTLTGHSGGGIVTLNVAKDFINTTIKMEPIDWRSARSPSLSSSDSYEGSSDMLTDSDKEQALSDIDEYVKCKWTDLEMVPIDNSGDEHDEFLFSSDIEPAVVTVPNENITDTDFSRVPTALFINL